MGNILATPHAANYRRTLSGSNRAKAIQNLDNETIDLAYVLYIYFILVLCSSLIYLLLFYIMCVLLILFSGILYNMVLFDFPFFCNSYHLKQ